MKISVAQIRSVKGDILTNIQSHKKLIDLALAQQADAICFPELSITGYEPELAKDLVTAYDDIRFNEFQKISNTNKISICIGLPTKGNSGILISMLIFQPEQPRQVYSKQQLHADELPYFVSGEKQIILTVKNKQIAPAICYESLQNSHSDNANKLGAEFYIASVAKPQNGINKAMIHYPAIAKKFSMPVLMSNCVGYCDNFNSVGKSSVWNARGALIAQLDDQQEGVLIYDTDTEEVVKQTL